MPGQTGRISRDEARSLARVARKASKALGPAAGLGELQAHLKKHPPQGTGRHLSATSHGIRLLRRAYEVFGDGLEDLLFRIGPTKTIFLAKLKDAVKIAKANEIKLPDGTIKSLQEISKRDLERVLGVHPLKSGDRQVRTPAPGDTFAVPRDAIALRRLLIDRLKSLRPRHEGVPPRFAVKLPSDENRRSAKANLRKELSNLKRVINVYRLLLEELLTLDLADLEGAQFPVKIDGKKHILSGTRIKGKKVLKALEKLADSGESQSPDTH